MEQKLTAQIARLYPDAEVLHTNCAGYAQMIKPQGIFGEQFISGMHLRVLHTAEHNVYFVNISDCQLILTPLSDITEADAIEVAKMLDLMGADAYLKHVGNQFVMHHFYRFVIEGRYKMYEVRVPITEPNLIVVVEIINFLRSKSYDCDNLIQSGIAIKS